MKNKKFEKILVKAGYGAIFTFLIGYTYKQGEKVNQAVDEKYEQKYNVPKKSTIFSR